MKPDIPTILWLCFSVRLFLHAHILEVLPAVLAYVKYTDCLVVFLCLVETLC